MNNQKEGPHLPGHQRHPNVSPPVQFREGFQVALQFVRQARLVRFQVLQQQHDQLHTQIELEIIIQKNVSSNMINCTQKSNYY